jgi:hypothetical protein
MFDGLSKVKVFGPFLFAEHTVTGIVCLDMLEKFLMPLLEGEGPDDILFQKDGMPPHFQNEVIDALNHKFPEKQIGRGGPATWPPC